MPRLTRSSPPAGTPSNRPPTLAQLRAGALDPATPIADVLVRALGKPLSAITYEELSDALLRAAIEKARLGRQIAELELAFVLKGWSNPGPDDPSDAYG